MVVLGLIGLVSFSGGLIYVAWRKTTPAAVAVVFGGATLLTLWWTSDIFENTSALVVLGRVGGALVITAILFSAARNKPIFGVKEGAEENPPSALWQASVIVITIVLIIVLRIGVDRLFG